MTPRERRRQELLAAKARIDQQLAAIHRQPPPPNTPGRRLEIRYPEYQLTPAQIRAKAEQHRCNALLRWGDNEDQQKARLDAVNLDADANIIEALERRYGKVPA